MKIKRMLALALSLTMVGASLAGCGTKTEGTGSKSSGSKAASTSSMKASTASTTSSAKSASTASETKAGGTLKLAAFEGGNGAEIWNQIKAAFEAETGQLLTFIFHQSLTRILQSPSRTEIFLT